MGEKQRNVSAGKQVAAINTDYVRSIERQENRKKAKKVRLFRRLAVFGVMSLVLVGFLISTLVNSNKTLEAKTITKRESLGRT